MAPVPSSSEAKFTGNVAFYLFRSQYRTPVFLERNINAVLERNEYLLQRSGRANNNNGETQPLQQTRTPRRRKRRIDDIVDGLKHKVVVTRNLDPELRIIVKSLSTRQSSRENPARPNGPLGIPFRCRLNLVLYAETGTEIYASTRTELQRDSKLCSASMDSTGSYCKLEMDEAFKVKASMFYIAETRMGSKGFTLAPRYTTELILEPTDRSGPWPPLALSNAIIEGDSYQLNIKATIESFPGDPQRTVFPAQYITGAGATRRPHGVALSWMEVDYGWNTPFKLAQPELVRTHIDTKRDLVILPPATVARKKPTPKEPSKAVTKVQYKFVDTDEEVTSKELEVTLDSYACLICQRQNFAHSQRLAFHLLLCHDLFEYSFNGTSKTRHGKCKITLEPSTKLSEFTGDNRKKDERLFVWLQRNKPFNVRTLLSGHWSWLREKNTPTYSNENDFVREGSNFGETIDEIVNCGELEKPRKKRFKVPEPKHFDKNAPVFMRSKTKRFVEPGEELSESDEDIDDEWIRMKHEDTIDDYEDIQESEKTMMKVWNRHLYEERPIGNAQVAASLVRFSRKQKELASSPVMLIEFWKMCLNFIQFGTIDTRTLKACMDIIIKGGRSPSPSRRPDATPGRTPLSKKPRKRLDGVQPISSSKPGKKIEVIDMTQDDDDEEPETTGVDYAGVCKCKRQWRRPEMVACEGESCKYGWYHLGCVGLTERPKGVPFFCDECKRKQKK